MLDLPDNDLLSAYIDGELTADEQTRVESLLANSADARRLVDELRALSTNLQSLPAYPLESDLTERVLRRAEREMLAEPATPLPKFHEVEGTEPQVASWAERLLRPQNFAWSAIAVAVAVVLMLMDPSQSGSGPTPSGTAHNDTGVVIQPLGGNPQIVSVEKANPEAEPTAIAEVDPPQPGTPDVDPQPAMVATSDTPGESGTANASQGTSDRLYILECQLADGRLGRDALAAVLEAVDVELDAAVKSTDKPVELELTIDQFNLVVAHLQGNQDQFAGFKFGSAAGTARPMVPSAAGADDPNSDDLPPEQAPGTQAVISSTPPEAQTPDVSPVRDDDRCVVRFVIEPAE